MALMALHEKRKTELRSKTSNSSTGSSRWTRVRFAVRDVHLIDYAMLSPSAQKTSSPRHRRRVSFLWQQLSALTPKKETIPAFR